MSKAGTLDDTSSIPNNNEVVDSLINDFKASCDMEPKTNLNTDQDIQGNEEPSKGDTKEGSFDKWANKFAESSEVDELEKPKADDYIDEQELKDKEESYTEEDFERLKKESDETKSKGNELFKNKEYMESISVYTLALRTCPLKYTKERAILYANRGASKIKLERTESAVEDCTKALELDPSYLKALIRRAQLYNTTDKLDEALEDYKQVLKLDPSNAEAHEALMRLPDQINERNEKLKTEMLGKMKDLGNVILRPFGLSTNNFQMVQDPNSGGYSISFKN